MDYTVELQWLEYLWNHENMFETGVVRSNECYRRARPRGIIGISFRFSLMLKYVVLFSLESPHPGDSNEYTQYTIFEYKKGRKTP